MPLSQTFATLTLVLCTLTPISCPLTPVLCPLDAVECNALTEQEEVVEQSCETLLMCLVTTIKEGMRAGGGISDVLRKPASTVCVTSILCFVTYTAI